VSHTAGSSVWQTHEFTDLDTASFGISPVVTSCTAPPCGPFKPTSFGQPLPPRGRVDAVGWFIDGTGANHRYDNYAIRELRSR
jgi:hypothetical protein